MLTMLLRRPVEPALAATLAVVNQPYALDRAAFMDGLLKGMENEAGMRGGADAPRC